MAARDGANGDTRGTSSSGQADNSDTKEEAKEKFLNITPEELWRPRKILSNKKGSLSENYKKNTEATRRSTISTRRRCKLWNLWQPCMLSSRRPEKISECDVTFEESRAAVDEFNGAQRVQEGAREELHDAQEAHAMAFMDLQR